MLFSVIVFRFDGSVKKLAEHVDLDYFTIRDWRKLYTTYYKELDSDKYSTLKIIPEVEDIF